jgi:hypothetical protein
MGPCAWGGSIVDSVVGAFLTQNVSDVLSSQAFLNVAAAFGHPDNRGRRGEWAAGWYASHACWCQWCSLVHKLQA